MCHATDNPVSCEIRAVMRCLRAKNMSAVEIRRKLHAAYGQNVMSEATVRQWCKMFNDGRTTVQNEERSGQPSVMSGLHTGRKDPVHIFLIES
jgi:transposase